MRPMGAFFLPKTMARGHGEEKWYSFFSPAEAVREYQNSGNRRGLPTIVFCGKMGNLSILYK